MLKVVNLVWKGEEFVDTFVDLKATFPSVNRDLVKGDKRKG